jgi:hypothetical protein
VVITLCDVCDDRLAAKDRLPVGARLPSSIGSSFGLWHRVALD